MSAIMTKCASTVLIFACVATVTIASPGTGERESNGLLTETTLIGKCPQRVPPPNYVPKHPGLYTRDDWAAVIDETWGPGISDAIKLSKFNAVYEKLTSSYACFQNLDFDDADWFALGDAYRAEITAGVSRGRIAGIMSHLTRRLKESHTHCNWTSVTYTALDPGVPLMWFGCWGPQDHLGAAVTSTLAGEALVYRVVPDHPLGLEPGDIILGYDGEPWSQLAAELVDAELPITGHYYGGHSFYWGGCESAINHSLQGAVGMNWHLFDEMDILKYSSGDTVSLATSAMVGAELTILASDQMPIEGIPFPEWDVENILTWGTVQHGDLEVGYIYVWAWMGSAEEGFAAAIMDLWDSDALIIDLRFNMGGWYEPDDPGFALLFDSTFQYFRNAERCEEDPYDLYSMCEWSPPFPEYGFVIGDPMTYFDKPIAVLLGPACVSMGDISAYALDHHPEVRFFGQSSSTSPNRIADFSATYLPAEGVYAVCNVYMPQDFPPDEYATHLEFEVDEEVWLTPHDVAQGVDTVVERALCWISLCPVGDVPQPVSVLEQNRPNPFNPQTTFAFEVPREEYLVIAVYDLHGRRIRVLADGVYASGRHEVNWNGKDAGERAMPSGSYVVRLEAESGVEARKMMLVR